MFPPFCRTQDPNGSRQVLLRHRNLHRHARQTFASGVAGGAGDGYGGVGGQAAEDGFRVRGQLTRQLGTAGHVRDAHAIAFGAAGVVPMGNKGVTAGRSFPTEGGKSQCDF